MISQDSGSGVSLGGHSARVTMIGGGQLARMTHQAAVDYAIALHVLAERADDPAVTSGAAFTLGRADSFAALSAAASCSEVTTFDHELVPRQQLDALVSAGYQLRPNPGALALAQDKLAARLALSALPGSGVATPAFAPVSTVADVAAFAADHGWPVVLKARSGGYDGRGVHVIGSPDDAGRLVTGDPAEGGEPVFLAEEHLDLAAEFAVLLARRPSGQVVSYPPIGTLQRDGICRELTMPAPLPAQVTRRAVALAKSIVTGIDATGVCAVEFFWTTDERLLVNELALRPHNSGHATIEACVTSQFHQHLRAVLDWPLGRTELVSAAATVNIIGTASPVDPTGRMKEALAIPGTHVHLYQKSPRPGRKLGHVTALAGTIDDALATARTAAALLTGP